LQKNIDFMKILKAVLEKWWLVLITTLTVGILAIIVTTTLIQNKYSSNVKLFTSSSDLSEGAITVPTIQMSQKLVQTYQKLLEEKDFYYMIEEELHDDIFQQSVRQLILEERTLSNEKKIELMRRFSTASGCNEFEYTAEQVRAMLEVEILGTTEIMEVTVTTGDPIHSFIVAKAVENRFAQRLTEFYPNSNFEVSLTAEYGHKTSPNRTRNTIIGAAVGMVIGVSIIVIALFLNNRIKSEDDLYLYYDIPLLGTIPDALSAPAKTAKKGDSYYSYYARQ